MSKLRNILNLRTLVGTLLTIIFLAVIAGGYYYYQSYQKLIKNPDIITKQEGTWLVEKISKLMSLPTGEEPSTATVLDKEKLKDQPFFANAENGDKILIYAKAKKAILYRPSTDKIIEVMPIALDADKNAEAGATTETIKIALLNGTDTDGLTNTAEINIKNKITNIEITSKEKAKKSDYKATVVVDINGTKAEQAKAIADAVGGTVGALPAGEAKPDADILVIVAK